MYEMRKCSRCKTEKELIEFQKEKTGRISSCCKDCRREIYIDWERRNPDKRRKLHIEYYERTKKVRRWDLILKKYNVTQEQYEELFNKQKGGCAICKSKEPKHNKSIHLLVDHCHTTGKVRGLLCNRCNTTLGLVDDNIKNLKTMIKYLKK